MYQEAASDDPTNKETVPMAAKVSALPGNFDAKMCNAFYSMNC